MLQRHPVFEMHGCISVKPVRYASVPDTVVCFAETVIKE